MGIKNRLPIPATETLEMRYCFHVSRDRKTFADEAGTDLKDDSAARLHASVIAAELAEDSDEYHGFHVLAVNEDGNEITRMPVVVPAYLARSGSALWCSYGTERIWRSYPKDQLAALGERHPTSRPAQHFRSAAFKPLTKMEILWVTLPPPDSREREALIPLLSKLHWIASARLTVVMVEPSAAT